MTKDYQITWQGIVHDQQGYARASREYLLALDRAGADIRIEPLNFGTPSAVLEHEQIVKLKELISKPLAKDKKKVLVYHAQPYGVNPNEERKKGFDKVIINTVWETTKVPDSWFPSVNQADAVVVPSTQNVQALIDSGVTVPIFKVPHGSDLEKYNPNNPKFDIPELDEKFKFLSIFQWQHRKAPDKLLKAFWQEFTDKDDVALIIKSYWGNDVLKSDQRHIMSVISQYKSHLGKHNGNTAPVLFSGSMFSDTELKGLYTNSNILVLPSRGEGVGLPYIEAMSSGIPCIATGWGGQTDFINENNGYLIDYKLKPSTEVEDQIAQNFFHLFTADMLWAEVDTDDLQKAMRHAYENKEEIKEKGIQARKDMEKMSWSQSGHIFKDAIETVLK